MCPPGLAEVVAHQRFLPSINASARCVRLSCSRACTLRAFGPCRAHDVVGGSVRGGVQVAGQDRKACGLAQHHHGKGGGGPTRHHQEICPRLAAGNGHHALVACLGTGNGNSAATGQGVEVEYTVERRPVDTDIDDLAQAFIKGVDQFGQLACYRCGMRPPRPVKVVVGQYGGQGNPGWAGQSPSVRRTHDVAVTTGRVAEIGWPAIRPVATSG